MNLFKCPNCREYKIQDPIAGVCSECEDVSSVEYALEQEMLGKLEGIPDPFPDQLELHNPWE